jgi:hypothetical protein
MKVEKKKVRTTSPKKNKRGKDKTNFTHFTGPCRPKALFFIYLHISFIGITHIPTCKSVIDFCYFKRKMRPGNGCSRL